MVVVNFIGGLGNQMFQYVFYEKLKTLFPDVKIDVTSFCGYKNYYNPNGYELKKVFGLDLPIASIKEIRRLKADSWNKFRRLKEKILGYPDSIYYQPEGHTLINDYRDNVHYRGVWMNLHYFPKDYSSIQRKFVFSTIVDKSNEQCLEEIKNRNSVAVHIRRGDYTNNPMYGSICNEAYYREAIKKIEEEIEDPFFYFFSDDPEWVKVHYSSPNMTVVDWNNRENSFMDMFLMSEAKHNIIANSTFSWWGAFLNKNPSKIVIGPSFWFKREMDSKISNTADAIMADNWIRISGSEFI